MTSSEDFDTMQTLTSSPNPLPLQACACLLCNAHSLLGCPCCTSSSLCCLSLPTAPPRPPSTPGLTMSVPRSMQRMVTVPRGRGMLAMMNSRKGVISGMLLVRV